MDILIGTPQCPHLGFDGKGGRPCCRADDETRRACGKWAPNPAARKAAAPGAIEEEPWFCTVLGADNLPPEALRAKARALAEERNAAREAPGGKFRPPDKVTGAMEPRPDRAQDFDAADPGQPVIPTHTLRNEGKRPARPNDPCPCGSGRKFKKCCGRGG